MKFISVLDYFLARLQEPSTWRGLVWVLTAVGVVVVDVNHVDDLVALGMTVAGVIGILAKK